MRIVSLCPSLTELLFDLGRGADVVGVTRFCVHPAEGVRDVEKVGGTKTPRVDRILELRPDIVLLNQEENRLEDAEALRAEGIRCHVSFPRSVADTASMVRSIGGAVESESPAESIARAIEEDARAAREAAVGLPRVRFAYLMWREPLMSVSGDTYISDLLTLAGGDNVFADRPLRYPVVEPEDVAGAAPHAVLLSTEPFPFRPQHADEISRRTALAPEIFDIVDGELISWHGSRTPAGIAYAAEVIRRVRADSTIGRS
jgi:ABC-type Fe3+-hydroxamate transport system substrate-binding protein